MVRTFTTEGPGSIPPWEPRSRKLCGAAKKKKKGKLEWYFRWNKYKWFLCDWNRLYGGMFSWETDGKGCEGPNMERQKYAKEFDIHLTIWIKIL